MLLSEGNDGIMSFLFGDGHFTGGQFFDNPVLDFLLLLWSKVLPALLDELFHLDFLEGVLGLSMLDGREHVDVVGGELGGRGDSDKGKEVEESHFCFFLNQTWTQSGASEQNLCLSRHHLL